MNNKRALVNTISSFFIYGVLLIFNIFSSRFVLISFGSEANGLLASVNQVFAYIALLEAGIGTATVTALYKPLSDKNNLSTAEVLSSSRSYYRKSAIWYFVCVIVASFVWPLVVDSEIPYFTIWGIIFFQGVSGVITFWFTSTIVNYLVASGRNYVNNNVHAIVTFLTYALKILICFTGANIVFISVSMVVVNAVKCLFYIIYMKRICPEFFEKRKCDLELLKQRNSFLIHEISGVIFSSTDTIVISIFCSLAEASVYSVYSLVLVALNGIIGQVVNGTYYILGDSYAKDKENYKKVHDTYNGMYIFAVFVIFTVAYLLLVPFISLYTQGVTDANYVDYKLPILFVLIQLLSACRTIADKIIKISLHAKQTISRTITESIINLTVSLILVNFIGIYGVLIGTIVALLYRTNDMIIYANKKILNRSPWNEYKLHIPNFITFFLVVFLSRFITIEASSYLQLVLIAIVTIIAVAVLYGAINIVINYKTIKLFILKRKNKN